MCLTGLVMPDENCGKSRTFPQETHPVMAGFLCGARKCAESGEAMSETDGYAPRAGLGRNGSSNRATKPSRDAFLSSFRPTSIKHCPRSGSAR